MSTSIGFISVHTGHRVENKQPCYDAICVLAGSVVKDSPEQDLA